MGTKRKRRRRQDPLQQRPECNNIDSSDSCTRSIRDKRRVVVVVSKWKRRVVDTRPCSLFLSLMLLLLLMMMVRCHGQSAATTTIMTTSSHFLYLFVGNPAQLRKLLVHTNSDYTAMPCEVRIILCVCVCISLDQSETTMCMCFRSCSPALSTIHI